MTLRPRSVHIVGPQITSGLAAARRQEITSSAMSGSSDRGPRRLRYRAREVGLRHFLEGAAAELA
jgi:hypothetical protein